MQSLLFRKVGRSKFARVRLSLAAVITAALSVICFSTAARSDGGVGAGAALTTCRADLLQNGGFELPGETPGSLPLNWSIDYWRPTSQLSRDDVNAHSGASSVRIMAPTGTDARFLQEVTVEPETTYMLTGWIKTENVSDGAGANLTLFGTWTHTEGLFGSNDWTRVSLWFNSGSSTRITIGARLGYWGAVSAGTAWFDDLVLTQIEPDGTVPRWKILVLIYDQTDAIVTDSSGVSYHMVGAMTPAEVERAALAATQFVESDIPALTSGQMIPELTIRYPDHALTQLDPYSSGWWPLPEKITADRDRAFDSVIVIWDPRVVDQYTGNRHWIGGGAAGIAGMTGGGQTYTAIISEATGYGHRNVFKHEWGHCILYYFEAIGASPQPTVINHAYVNQYVHWSSGESYVWLDETDTNPIPNSIYNNESGFTHDYYSGTTATADQPTRRLGITPEAWRLGGPVTKPGIRSSSTPVITCNEDITVTLDANTCATEITLTPPTVSDACESNLTASGTRSDDLPLDGPFPAGQTIVTWSVTNRENVTATCRQRVTVTDNEPPVIVEVTASPSTLWPPNHDMVDVTVNYEAADNCAILETSLSVSSNEPAGDGAGSEWEIVDAHHVRLRAVRERRWGERLYTVTITAKDIHGNTSSQDVTVRVPLHKEKGSPW